MDVSVFNGAGQADYLYGLISGLVKTPIKKIDVLDINLSESLFNDFGKVRFHVVYKYQKKNASYLKKAYNLLRFYFLQSAHLLFSKKRVIHFQWLDRYYVTDRILLPLLTRLRGHKMVFTVHNVNAGKRDKRDSYYNRFTLHMVYNLSNHLIVHTPASKNELIEEFNVDPNKISIIKHGMNNKVTVKGLNQLEARKEFNIDQQKKVILFFGNIDYYKGLDILLDSLIYLPESLKKDIVLLIAGNYKSVEYISNIRVSIENSPINNQIISHIKFINDTDIERYFMAADCIVLPYRDIYQSGVLFMAYNFGLPCLATRVGNFENDIPDGKTGYLIDKIDSVQVANTIVKYFSSELFKDLNKTRNAIRDWSNNQFSWDTIGKDTYNVYQKLKSDKSSK